MNRFFQWLTGSANEHLRLEAKGVQNLVAFHAGGEAIWNAFESTGPRYGYSQNPVVYRCVRMISEAAASIPLKVCECRLDCDHHPMLDILAKPNVRQSGARFFEALYGHLLISGNAFVTRIHLDDTLRELHILDPGKMSPVLDESGWPKSWEYQTGSGKTRYLVGEKSELLHLASFNPNDAVNGLPPLSAAHKALDLHNAASAWNKALLDNSARPSGALVYAASAGENLSEEQFDRLRHELEIGYSGANRAGRPMVLEGGLDWKAMGFSPRDMDFLQAKNGAAREIALAFGVPPMLLGIPGDNTYSNYREANRAFWLQTVMPLVARTAQDLGNWLVEDFAGEPVLKPDEEQVSVLSEEREARWQRIGNADFLSNDEKRQALGFEPLGDFDQTTGMDHE